MALLQTVFFTFIALGVLVTFHEFGHFWVARRCAVRVERFSIGFGKPLWRWRDKKNTEFVLAALPLGGYVKMLDEREAEVNTEDLPYAFSQKTIWQRMAIISAGPIANFLLAILAFWLVFLSGERGLIPVIGDVVDESLASRAGFESGMEIVAVNGVETSTWGSVNRQLFDYIGSTGEMLFTLSDPDAELPYQVVVPVSSWLRDMENPAPLRELGISPPFELEALILAAVSETGAGFAAGLREGDVLLSVNGQQITNVDMFIGRVSSSLNTRLTIELKRPHKEGAADEFLTLQVMPKAVQRDGRTVGQLGVQLASKGRYPEALIRTIEYGLGSAFTRSLRETVDTTGFILSSLGKLVVGDLSPKNLSGPITIAKMAGDTARAGTDNFIRFIAILSIMLGVMNLLPIPVLDGGHLLYCLIELVKGSPVSDQVQMLGYKIGFAMLVGLMVFATFNDLTRSF